MIKRIYSVYDVKTGIYGPIFVQISDGEAMRTIGDEVNNEQSSLCKHPFDYRLDFLGQINLVTGEIITTDSPKHIIDLSQLKEIVKEK